MKMNVKQLVLLLGAKIGMNGSWILTIINLAWMLFKDTTLFSWWYPIASLVTGLTFLAVGLISLSKN